MKRLSVNTDRLDHLTRRDAIRIGGMGALALWSCRVETSFAGDDNSREATAALLEPITQKLESGRPLVFATFGDSITWPCFHTNFIDNYITLTVAALRQAYPQADVRIVHAGNMGTTARGLAEDRFEKHVLDHNPDVVFLMFGMNDCLAGEEGLVRYSENLTTLIKKTQAAGAVPVVCNQNDILYDNVDGRRRTTLPLYMQRAIETAAASGVPSVDRFDKWRALRERHDEFVARLNDWIHPNLAGHRLLAKSIVETLWPQAAKFVSDTVLTDGDDAMPAAAGLVPGPAGKQMLRVNETWFVLSGGWREETAVELNISWSTADKPRWDEFEHVTLVGGSSDALFDRQGRTITSAMLLATSKRVWVVFSWNTGVFFVSLDIERPDWPTRARTAREWIAHSAEPFLRPTALVHHQRGEARLFDAFEDGGVWPSAICWNWKMNPDAGFEIVEGNNIVALVRRGDDGEITVQELAGPRSIANEGPPGMTHWLSPTGTSPRLATLVKNDDGLEFSVID